MSIFGQQNEAEAMVCQFETQSLRLLGYFCLLIRAWEHAWLSLSETHGTESGPPSHSNDVAPRSPNS